MTASPATRSSRRSRSRRLPAGPLFFQSPAAFRSWPEKAGRMEPAGLEAFRARSENRSGIPSH
jgi:hypothetical protein